MQLISYILFFYSFLFNSLFAMLESQLIEEFEQINSLSNLPESQRIENRKEMNKILENANAKLRLKFTSDKNFEQFKLLQNADSFEDVGLIVKFLNAAIGNNTISKEEVQMFRKCKENLDVLLLRKLYILEEKINEEALRSRKVGERRKECVKKMDEANKKLDLQCFERDKERRERLKTDFFYRMCYQFFYPEYLNNANQKSVVPETNLENVETTEIMFQKDMDEKEKKKQERDISNLELV